MSRTVRAPQATSRAPNLPLLPGAQQGSDSIDCRGGAVSARQPHFAHHKQIGLFAVLVQACEKQFICPGEVHPISRAVHLSRLAAFYPACRECPFRTDVGQLPRQAVERLQQTERRVERKSLFETEWVRGVWLNEITRSRAGVSAAAFAAALWESAPVSVRSDDAAAGRLPLRPSLVIGHDERPSAPDIITGVASALRRMGCQVIDIGLSTRPMLCFGVEHLQAAGGIFVTGAGAEPSWTGLDFVGRHGLPLSRSAVNGEHDPTHEEPRAEERAEWLDLEAIERRIDQPIGRPTRQSVPHRTFHATVPYEAGLWKHFHALRPLHVVCGSGSRLVRRTLERLFASLPCRISFVDLPERVRRLNVATDADVVRVSRAVESLRGDLGVVIDEDGQRCAFLEERGRLVPTYRLGRLLGGLLLADQSRGTIVAEHSEAAEIAPVAIRFGGKLTAAVGTQSGIARGMHETEAVFGVGPEERFWFRESIPTCDAIVTLAKVLDLLSRNDVEFSDVVAAA